MTRQQLEELASVLNTIRTKLDECAAAANGLALNSEDFEGSEYYEALVTVECFYRSSEHLRDDVCEALSSLPSDDARVGSE